MCQNLIPICFLASKEYKGTSNIQKYQGFYIYIHNIIKKSLTFKITKK